MNEKVRGVCLKKSREKWEAYICIDGNRKYLGLFDTYEEAVKARKDAEIKYNFIPVTPVPKLKHRNDLTQERLKELLHYDPETGIFTRLVSQGTRGLSGDVAGSINNKGYIHISIDHTNYKAHRLAFLYMTGEFPEDNLQVDHINHKKDDNQWVNLRVVTNQENHKNRSLNKNNKAGYTGVCWCKTNNKWISTIKVDGKQKNLGYFDNLDDAIAARKQAEIKYNYHKNHGINTNTQVN